MCGGGSSGTAFCCRHVFCNRWGVAATAVFACTRDLIMRQPGLCPGSGPACTRQPACLAARTACPNSVPAALAAPGLNVSISVLGILPAGGYPRAANLSIDEPQEPVDTPQASAGHVPGLGAYPHMYRRGRSTPHRQAQGMCLGWVHIPTCTGAAS